MKDTQIRNMMAPRPEIINPGATLEEACLKMKEVDCGVLPVGTSEHVEGMITDRDIVIRAIAAGVDPAIAIVRDYMTLSAHACKMQDDLKDAARTMNIHNVSRLLVQDESGNVVGILSFGHALRSDINNAAINDMVCCAVGRESAA